MLAIIAFSVVSSACNATVEVKPKNEEVGTISQTQDSNISSNLNEAKEIGTLEFTMNSFQKQDAIIFENNNKKPNNGQFFVAEITVKNMDKKSQQLITDLVKLVDSTGSEYDIDLKSSLFINGGPSLFGTKVNPNTSISGKIVFDLPKDIEITHAKVPGKWIGDKSKNLLINLK